VRRTEENIREDYRKILEASSEAASVSELAEKTGLTKSQVLTTLQKIKLEELSIYDKPVKKVVIDASVVSSTKLEEYLNREDFQFVLTTITIEELSRMKTRSDREGFWTRQILKMSKNNPQQMTVEKVPAYYGKGVMSDKFIVRYCKEKQYAILTSDVDMLARAKAERVKVIFIENDARSVVSLGALDFKSKGNLVFRSCCAMKWIAVLIRDGKEVKNPDGKQVQMGDEIYKVLKINDEYLKVKKYKVVALADRGNAMRLQDFEIFDFKDIPEGEGYTQMLKDAWVYL